MVHKCATQSCNAMIDEKYPFCLSCNDKERAKVSTGTSVDLMKVLERINANLYCLRQLKAAELEAEHKIILRLDETSGKYLKEKITKRK